MQSINLESNPEQEAFTAFIGTLLYSWGSDTPPEAIWALNNFVSWINLKYDLSLESPTESDYFDENSFDEKLQKIISTINEEL